MTTVQQMLSDTRRTAFGAANQKMNFVGTSAVAGATDIVMELDVSEISAGQILSCGLNVWYVRSVNVATKTVTVVTGIDGSPESAVSAGDVVLVNPTVTDWYILNMLNAEIARLSSPTCGLYGIGSWEADADIVYGTYTIPDAAANMTGILRVRFRMIGSTDAWFDVPPSAVKAQFGDGSGVVRLTRMPDPGTKVQFIYKSTFQQATSLDDDAVDDLGLAETMVDIPPLGAVASVLRTVENARLDIRSQANSRRPSEVREGTNMSLAQAYTRDRDARIDEERARLTVRYPVFRGI